MIQGLITAFAFTSIWWYVASLFFVVLWVYLSEERGLFRGLFVVLLYVLFLRYVAHIPVFQSIGAQPSMWFLAALIYVFIGFCWSLVKWYLYVQKSARSYKTKRKEWLIRVARDHANASIRKLLTSPLSPEQITEDTPVPKEIQTQWNTYITCHTPYTNIGWEGHRPVVSDHKKLIATWILHWPASFLWSLLHDLLDKLVKELVMRLRRVYEYITEKAYT